MNPDDYIGFSLQSDNAKQLIQKRIIALRRRTSREKAKEIADLIVKQARKYVEFLNIIKWYISLYTIQIYSQW